MTRQGSRLTLGPLSRSAGVFGCNHRRYTSRRAWKFPFTPMLHRSPTYISFRSCRSFMQVLAAFAISLPVWSLTSHSTYPKVLPAFTTLASAAKVAFRTAPRKLIFNSMVVNDSPPPG